MTIHSRPPGDWRKSHRALLLSRDEKGTRLRFIAERASYALCLIQTQSIRDFP